MDVIILCNYHKMVCGGLHTFKDEIILKQEKSPRKTLSISLKGRIFFRGSLKFRILFTMTHLTLRGRILFLETFFYNLFFCFIFYKFFSNISI